MYPRVFYLPFFLLPGFPSSLTLSLPLPYPNPTFPFPFPYPILPYPFPTLSYPILSLRAKFNYRLQTYRVKNPTYHNHDTVKVKVKVN